MLLHEIKNCPSCNQVFECKVGDISNCDCTLIHLSLEEKAFVKDLKNKYILFKEKYFG